MIDNSSYTTIEVSVFDYLEAAHHDVSILLILGSQRLDTSTVELKYPTHSLFTMLDTFMKLTPKCGLVGCLRSGCLSLSFVRVRNLGTESASEFQLLSTDEKAGVMEEKLYSRRIHDIEGWWRTPRFEGIKRPYSAEDVVSKSGSLEQTYPSSLMAKKLFKLLQERSAASAPVHTSASLEGKNANRVVERLRTQ